MRIDVTREDIVEGMPLIYAGDSCPVALAIKRSLLGRDIWVSEESVYTRLADEGPYSNPIPLPFDVSRWIGDAMNGRPVEPISFEIDL